MISDHEHTLIASVQRALRLVDKVANATRPLPVKALSQASGLSLGTTYNLVRTLIHEGYLSSEPDGLVLGARFPTLRAGHDDGIVLARVRKTLHCVTEDLGATAYFSQFSDGEVRIIDILDVAPSSRVELRVGIHNSAHATALGKQLLAELDDEGRLDYVSRHPLAKHTRHTISDRRILLAQLEHHADAAIDQEEYAMGYTCIAVPVWAPDVNASIAVSLSSNVKSVDLDAKISRMKAWAAKLSLQLSANRFAQFTI